MAGPTVEVLIEREDGAALDAVHDVLAAAADPRMFEPTRKGRHRELWVGGRPVTGHVRGWGDDFVDDVPAVILTAGCDGAEDRAVLAAVAARVVAATGGGDGRRRRAV